MAKKVGTLKRCDLSGFGSIIIITAENQMLGDLMHFAGHGVYDSAYGRVPVEPDEATAHNEALSKAMIEGLDKTCDVGQGGYAYLSGGPGAWRVRSFIGMDYAESVAIGVVGKVVTFSRGDRVFRGTLRAGGEAFNFRRIA